MLDARELLAPSRGVRDQNRRNLIIEVMIKADRQSRIARRLGVSAASVSSAVAELAAAGVVVDGRYSAPRRGHGQAIGLTETRGLALGVELGFQHTTVIGRRVDRPFSEICVRRREEGANRGFANLLGSIQEMIDEVAEEAGQELTDVVSAGIAVPRMIDPRSGRFTTPILAPWTKTDEPAKALERMLQVRVPIDNDANLGVMAEQLYGLDEPMEMVVYVKASAGIGAGIMIGGKVLRGDRGIAGEIGHLTIERGGEVCVCGGRGCLDTVIGADALLTQAHKALRHTLHDKPSNLRSLVEQALTGNAACRRILNDAGRTLGLGLAQLCNLINPRLIVLGGELAVGNELVIEPCMQELRRFGLPGAVSADDGFTVRASSLGSLSEAQGALILGLRARQLENFS
jgi:predicted NBD/HSP70 family sugar kinase